MKNYNVSAVVTISLLTKVKAESKKEAERIAGDREDIEKTEWGQDWKVDEMWVADEYDGEPYDICAEEDDS